MYNIWKKRAEEGYFFNTLADLKNSALLQVLKADETNRFQSGPNFGKWMQHFFFNGSVVQHELIAAVLLYAFSFRRH
jgi:hypothetical protein